MKDGYGYNINSKEGGTGSLPKDVPIVNKEEVREEELKLASEPSIKEGQWTMAFIVPEGKQVFHLNGNWVFTTWVSKIEAERILKQLNS